jgi:hypothetical protein
MRRGLRGRAAVARGGKIGGGKTAGDGASVVAEQGVESRLEEGQVALAHERRLLRERHLGRPSSEVLLKFGDVR